MDIWIVDQDGTSYGITFTAFCAPKRDESKMIYLREGYSASESPHNESLAKARRRLKAALPRFSAMFLEGGLEPRLRSSKTKRGGPFRSRLANIESTQSYQRNPNVTGRRSV
jgi:hypothetical protein